MASTTRMYSTISKEGERAYVTAIKRKMNGKDVTYIRPSGPRLRHGQRVFVVESQYEGDYTLTTIFRQQKHAEQWHQATTPAADEVPHCPSCEENPAAEGDGLCLPCAQLRDAQSVRQENDDSWGNRGGCSYRDEDIFSRDQHNPYCHTCCTNEHAAGPCPMARREEDIASWQRIDDGYRKQALRARAGAVALALTMALPMPSASAADYTPTAPIGCTITHYWAEDDMSAIAVCAGSYTIHKEAGPIDEWDIPCVIDTITVGPDTNGAYWDFPIYD